MLGEKGEKINDLIGDNVAEPVSLHAKAVQYNDWKVLYVKPGSIKRTGGLSLFKQYSKGCNPSRSN